MQLVAEPNPFSSIAHYTFIVSEGLSLIKGHETFKKDLGLQIPHLFWLLLDTFPDGHLPACRGLEWELFVV